MRFESVVNTLKEWYMDLYSNLLRRGQKGIGWALLVQHPVMHGQLGHL